MREESKSTDLPFVFFNVVVSSAALTFLAWLLVLRDEGTGTADLSFMPAVNAGFNALSAVLLALGLAAIKRGRRSLHKRLMVLAFASSTLFLLGYVAYHYVHGDTKYLGAGPLRVVYFAVLISHILLSTAIVPMALTSFYFALRERFGAHARVARVLMPIWLYVSVTGVLIFFMLRAA